MSSLRELKNEEVGNCRDCSLCYNRGNIVFGRGDPNANVMFVGEAPGRQEDKQGKPFVGKSGQLLDEMIEDAGIESFYISNIAYCRPPSNRDPQRNEIDECLPYTMRQIDIIDPTSIVAIGKFAANELAEGPKRPLYELLGEYHLEYKYNGLKAVVPIYHPAYWLHNDNMPQEEKIEDIKDTIERINFAKRLPF